MKKYLSKSISNDTFFAKLLRTFTAFLPVDKSRQGKCLRCAACCRLPYTCPFLGKDSEGNYTCKIHIFRPLNCRKYPRTSEESLTKENCGYSFDRKKPA